MFVLRNPKITSLKSTRIPRSLNGSQETVASRNFWKTSSKPGTSILRNNNLSCDNTLKFCRNFAIANTNLDYLNQITKRMANAEKSHTFDSFFLTPESKKEYPQFSSPPSVNAKKWLINGELRDWSGETYTVRSPIIDTTTGQKVVLGEAPSMKGDHAVETLNAAVSAFNNGRGFWATCPVSHRIECMEKFTAGLKKKRDEIATLLMWEICKNKADAEKEVDRTILYINQTIKELKSLENRQSTFTMDSDVFAQVRRAPIGVVLCLGPFNYPFNETYCTLIPAILMGNCVLLKLPRVGVLCHTPTLELFKECFPPGVINTISGSGRETMSPVMHTGKIDILAFIGTSNAADKLQQAHPKPHRLRVCLGLEAKNPAIILPDADLAVTVRECIIGSFSFNGQRCTALKIIFVHKSIADKFVEEFAKAVDNLKMGLPWAKDTAVTPLPEEEKPKYLEELIADAVSKGAKIVNPRGGQVDRSFVAPTVLYPCTPSMRAYHEEQFGPIVPIATFESMEEIYDELAKSQYGQQASVFSKDPHAVGNLIDVLVNQVSRVNLNSSCQRGPDSFPFTGRKDSAYGTLSVSDALRVFSVRSLVAAKHEKPNEQLVNSILNERQSNFLRLDYLF